MAVFPVALKSNDSGTSLHIRKPGFTSTKTLEVVGQINIALDGEMTDMPVRPDPAQFITGLLRARNLNPKHVEIVNDSGEEKADKYVRGVDAAELELQAEIDAGKVKETPVLVESGAAPEGSTPSEKTA